MTDNQWMRLTMTKKRRKRANKENKRK